MRVIASSRAMYGTFTIEVPVIKREMTEIIHGEEVSTFVFKKTFETGATSNVEFTTAMVTLMPGVPKALYWKNRIQKQ